MVVSTPELGIHARKFLYVLSVLICRKVDFYPYILWYIRPIGMLSTVKIALPINLLSVRYDKQFLESLPISSFLNAIFPQQSYHLITSP